MTGVSRARNALPAGDRETLVDHLTAANLAQRFHEVYEALAPSPKRSATPPEFRDVLLAMARSVSVPSSEVAA